MRTLIVTLALLMGLQSTLRAEEAAAFQWQGSLVPDQRIEVRNINGNIHLEQAAGDMVEVSATITGTRPDPASIWFDVLWDESGVAICVMYPGGVRCGNVSVTNSDVQVDIVVRVPARVAVKPRTVNGSITATLADNPVDAETVNGRIAISTAGDAQAKAVNGSIHVSLGNPSWSGKREFKLVNGSVTVELAPDANAKVHGEIVIGTIATDYSIPVHRGFLGSKLDGTLGTGGPELSLGAVVGSLQLRRAVP